MRGSAKYRYPTPALGFGRTSNRGATAALLLWMLASGCGVIVPDDDVFLTGLSPTVLVLEVGESATLTATTESVSDATAQITFRSVNSSVATAEATGLTTGRVTGVSIGSTEVEVASPDDPDGVRRAQVQVVAEVRALELEPTALMLEPGQTGELLCEVFVQRTGASLPDEPVTYTTSLSNIATVDGNGVVTAVAEGQAVITCQAEGAAPVTALVNVFIPRVTEIDPSTRAMVVGESQTFVCTTRHAVTGDVLNETYTWITSDASVASVDQNGSVVALADGTATITCRVQRGNGAQATVTVGDVVFDVEVTPAMLTLAPGQTSTLTCTVRNADTGEVVTDRSYTWRSNDESVARVNSLGTVTGVGAGETVILCELDTGEVGSARVTVSVPPDQQPLCAPGRSDTNVLKSISSILRGDLTSFCSNATSEMDTGPVSRDGEEQPRSLDHTSIRHAGGVPSWSLGQAGLDGLTFTYPCGPNANGYTACTPGASATLPAGEYVMVYTVLHAPLPAMDAGFAYQYAFTFDRDGDPGNNYTDPSVPSEYFADTDFWIVVQGEAGGAWSLAALDARNDAIVQESTEARAIIDGQTMFVIVPSSHFGIDDPALRFSIYRADGNGNWSGDVQRPVGQPLYTLPIVAGEGASR